MGEATASTMAKDNATFYGSYQKQFSQTQPHAHVVLLESLRRIHSGRLVTVNNANTDPFEFAEAGFATSERVNPGVDDLVQHRYVGEDNRINGGDGHLTTHVDFGQYSYTYKGVTSIIYVAEWPTPDGCTQRIYYYIAPEQDPQSEAWATSIIKAGGKYNSELHNEIYIFDGGYWRKDESLWKSVQSASWDDVILDPAMKKAIIKDVDGFFESRALYEEYGVPWKRGIIIHGTPGCGKTVSIKALMKEIHRHGAMSLYVKSFSSNQGSNQAVRNIFDHARKMAPCMLIFEDLDSLVVDKIRSYFLNEVDGLENNHGILMIGSTNHLERLDAGISKRPSRFDRKYHFKLPAETERMLYCNYWQTKLRNNAKLDFSRQLCQFVVDNTEGFSFAYLKELFVQTLLAIVGGRAEDPEEDLDAVVADVADNSAVDENSSRLLGKGEKTDSTEADIGTGGASGPTAGVSGRQHAVTVAEVPAELQSNPLARVFRLQIMALRKDMDNTDDETDKDDKDDKKNNKKDKKNK